MKQLFPLALALVLSLVVGVNSASAAKINVSNNGANSSVKVSYSSSNKFSAGQSNNSNTTNNVVISTNTGNNSANKTTNGKVKIKTGSTSSQVYIHNQSNLNHMEIDLCCEDGEGDEHCDDPNPTPKPTKTPTPTQQPTPTATPTPEVCDPTEVFGYEVEDNTQGTLKTGDPITDPARMDVSKVLGSPDNLFYSLGKQGVLTVRFQSPVADLAGDDLSFHEITNGRDTYPEEKAQVSVSANGSDWFPIGEVSNLAGGDGVDYLDISPSGLAQINYVRLTDSTDFGLHNNEADGYDVDAIDAVVRVCQ